MMTQYVKPTMIKLGNSEELIQGECGWGSENWIMDKTGGYITTRRKKVQVGWSTSGPIYQCVWERDCSSVSHEC